MSVADTTKERGARSGAEAAADRVPEKHTEEANPSRIAELAYRLYEERGRQAGHELEDWLEAERRVSAQPNPAKKPASKKRTAAGVDAPSATEPELRDRLRQATEKLGAVKQRRV
jgi:hypothetical protein